MIFLLFVTHILTFFCYSAGIYYDVQPPPGSEFEHVYKAAGGRGKFLTFLNMLLQCGYFALAMINDLVGSDEIDPSKQTSLQRFRDWLFSSIVLPIGVVVSVLFWGLYAIDRELIFPSSMDAWFPGWLNHIMHSLPLMGVMVEVVATYHQYQTSNTKYLPVFSCYVLYVSLLCYIAYFGGFWVYPVFAALELPARTVFLVFLCIPPVMFYILGEKIHYLVWGGHIDAVMKPQKLRRKIN